MILSKLLTKKSSIFVVRDDLLSGGTKSRGAKPFLRYLNYSGGFDEFTYASPFSGFAQIALALAAADCKFKSRIFCEKDPVTKQMSKFTERISEISNITLCDSLTEAESLSIEYAEHNPKCFKVPLGFKHDLFSKYLKNDISSQLTSIILDYKIDRLWVSTGSGTLATILREVTPSYVQINCVNVKVLSLSDERIQKLTKLKNVNLLNVDEEFSQPAALQPSIPSNLYYDAKVFRLLDEEGSEKDLWWNVAS